MKFRRLIAILAASVLIAPLLVAVESTILPVSKASALSGVEFDPGNIISDALFFDGNAMTAAQIQDFLVSQETPCAPNIDCAFEGLLRTPTMAAEAGMCNSYAGANIERVADVIARVGQACGVSQKVLLVLIQKEQHLISSKSPTQRMYDKATGFACPDTAPCDAAYSGFFFQVWYAARQFKLYALRPERYGHLAGRFNAVRYNPDAGCGASNIYIANQATAGLYNYTPYQPNIDALNNLYGEGSYCSSYGNRNFWAIYTNWFGPTTSPTAIQTYYASMGGASGDLGPVQSMIEYFTGSGGGTGQRFASGSVMSSSAGTFAIFNGAIRNEYFSRGGPSSSLGWPIAAQVCVGGSCSQQFQGGMLGVNPISAVHQMLGGDVGVMGPAQGGYEPMAGLRGNGTGQRFLNGSILSNSVAGTFPIMNGPVRDAYFAAGGPASVYGWPVAAEVCADGVCTQEFQGGTIRPGPIAVLYYSLGASAGVMGPALSTTIESFAGRGGGNGQRFLNGSIMSSRTAGTFAVMNGPIRTEYFALGGPSGVYGWPTAAQVCVDGACTQQFQGGTLPGPIAALHASLGGNAGVMGAAASGIETFSARGGGTGQRYANGSIMSSPTAGTFAIMNGPIRNEYFAKGGPAGTLGWPIAAQTCVGAACSQAFEGGTITPGGIPALHASLGGDAGVLGPAASSRIETFSGHGGGTGQRFTNGSVMSSPTAGTFAIMNGPIRDEYFASGGPSGTFGWPTAAEVCVDDVCSQAFQGGTIPGPIATYFASLGGSVGIMGSVQSGLEAFTGRGGGLGQRYLNGSIMSSSTAGTWAIMNGPIRNEYFARGGPSGTYGWPTAAQTCVGSVCSQTFQGGTITR